MVSRNGLVALVLFALVAMIGCGGDDKGSSGDLGLAGDAQYSAVTSQLDQTNDWMNDQIEDAFATMPSGSSLDDVFMSAIGADSVNASEWTVLYHSNLSASVTTTIIDSIQYRNDGQIQYQSLGADQINYRHVTTQTDGDTTNGYTNYVNQTNVTISGLDAQMAVLNGTSSLNLETRNGSTWREYSIDLAAEGLNMTKVAPGQWNSKCPSSGTITANIELSVSVSGSNPVTENWTATIVYNDGDATVTVMKSELSASYSQNCQL